ncbi:MAG: hypothetical protein Q7V63_09450 [Gammaproteobacteria bacterium]|nr:hypothetical protein [Gammaproteobacteria bacterium]
MAFAAPRKFFKLNQNAIARIHTGTDPSINGIYTDGIENCMIFILSDSKGNISMSHLMMDTSPDCLIEEFEWLSSRAKGSISLVIYANDKDVPGRTELERRTEILKKIIAARTLLPDLPAGAIEKYRALGSKICAIARENFGTLATCSYSIEAFAAYESINKAVNDINVYFNIGKPSIEFDGDHEKIAVLNPQAITIIDLIKVKITADTKEDPSKENVLKVIKDFLDANLRKFDNPCFRQISHLYESARGGWRPKPGESGPDDHLISLAKLINQYLDGIEKLCVARFALPFSGAGTESGLRKLSESSIP